MTLGVIQVTVIDADGNTISTQQWDLNTRKGLATWERLWRWALHQGHSIAVKPTQPITSIERILQHD